jgi:hypothetical protein
MSVDCCDLCGKEGVERPLKAKPNFIYTVEKEDGNVWVELWLCSGCLISKNNQLDEEMHSFEGKI